MIDNNNPIKEYKPFRPGIDSLTENDEINSVEGERVTEYDNLHECSDDLSDRGSKLEEIAHAKYAEYQRRIKLGGTSNVSNNNQLENNRLALSIIVIIFVVIPIIQMFGGFLLLIIKSINEQLLL